MQEGIVMVVREKRGARKNAENGVMEVKRARRHFTSNSGSRWGERPLIQRKITFEY